MRRSEALPVLLLVLGLIGVSTSFDCYFCETGNNTGLPVKVPPLVWDTALPVKASAQAGFVRLDNATTSYQIFFLGGLVPGLLSSTQYSNNATVLNLTFNPVTGLDADSFLLVNNANTGNYIDNVTGASVISLPATTGYSTSSYNNQKGLLFMWGGARYANGQLSLPPRSDIMVVVSPNGSLVNLTLINAGNVLPLQRLYHSMVYTDFYGLPGSGILFGGLGGSQSLGDTYIFNFSVFNWTQVSTSLSPPARSWHGATGSSTGMYIFGGTADTKNGLNDLWYFDYAKRNWTQLPSMGSVPAPRFDTHLHLIQPKRLLVLTGRQDLVNGPLYLDAYEYDLVKKIWSVHCSDLTSFKYRFNSNSFDLGSGKVLFYGGISFNALFLSAPRVYDSQVWRTQIDCPNAPLASSTHCLGKRECFTLEKNNIDANLTACTPASPFRCMAWNATSFNVSLSCVPALEGSGACPRQACDPYQFPYTCWNGQCARSAEECVPIFRCAPGEKRCSNGTCAASCANPGNATCKSGEENCANGCKPIGTCQPFNGCPSGFTQCPDGTCSNSNLSASQLCAAPSLCPSGNISCPDGTCVSSIGLCSVKPLYWSSFKQAYGRQLGSITPALLRMVEDSPLAYTRGQLQIQSSSDFGYIHFLTPSENLVASWKPHTSWAQLRRGVPARSGYQDNILSLIYSTRLSVIQSPSIPLNAQLLLEYEPRIGSGLNNYTCLGYLDSNNSWQCAPQLSSAYPTTYDYFDLNRNNAVHSVGGKLSVSLFRNSYVFPEKPTETVLEGVFAIIRSGYPCPTINQILSDVMATVTTNDWNNLTGSTLNGTALVNASSAEIKLYLQTAPASGYEQAIANFFLSQYCLPANWVAVALTNGSLYQVGITLIGTISFSLDPSTIPSPVPTPVPTPTPTPLPIPSPVSVTQPSPLWPASQSPSDVPSSSPSLVLSSNPSPIPTPEPTPEPTPLPTPEPTPEPAPSPEVSPIPTPDSPSALSPDLTPSSTSEATPVTAPEPTPSTASTPTGKVAPTPQVPSNKTPQVTPVTAAEINSPILAVVALTFTLVGLAFR